jgi:hypothetical protein
MGMSKARYNVGKVNGNGGFSGIWESYSNISQERWDAIFKKDEEVKEEDDKDNG